MFLFLSNRRVVNMQHCINQLRRVDTIDCYYLRNRMYSPNNLGFDGSKKLDDNDFV